MLFNQVVETHPMLFNQVVETHPMLFNHAIMSSFLEIKLYSQLMQSDFYHRNYCDQPTCL